MIAASTAQPELMSAVPDILRNPFKEYGPTHPKPCISNHALQIQEPQYQLQTVPQANVAGISTRIVKRLTLGSYVSIASRGLRTDPCECLALVAGSSV